MSNFLRPTNTARLLMVNIAMAWIYFYVIAFMFDRGNLWLFSLLMLGEIFHLTQVVGYCWTVWGKSKRRLRFASDFKLPVDVFITVCGEPIEIIERTARAALAMDYPNHRVYILNDGLVAKRDNWREVVQLGQSLGVEVITRQKPGGAKAGNINHGMSKTASPYIVIFDADHVPHADFLQKTMGFFADRKMAFVQTPQYYYNQKVNSVAATSWEQQTLFFGPIMMGKQRLNSVFMCGTNMVLNRKALMQVGGMCETNIAEDFLTSLFIHNKGWKSAYVPEVLAEGLAPEDFMSYYKQQFRWARGSLEVIFKHNPLFMTGLTWVQKLQYLVSAGYYLSGLVILLNALLPVIFLYTGQVPIEVSTMDLAFVFIPYLLLNLYVLQATSNFSYSFRAISFSLGSWYLQLSALFAVLTNHKTAFTVTSKRQVAGNFLYLSIPHITYFLIAAVGVILTFQREGLSASLAANTAWVLLALATFIPFVIASSPGSFNVRSLVGRQLRRVWLLTARAPE